MKLRKNYIHNCIKKNKKGINLTREVQDLYTENYKTLPKKLKKIWINEETFHVHRSEGLILLKWQFNTVKNDLYFQNLRSWSWDSYRNAKDLILPKQSWKKKDLTLPNFKTYYKATQTRCLQKDYIDINVVIK